MQDYGSTKVVQVTNIAPQATRDQMYTLFSNVGMVEDIKLYPSMRAASINIQSRVCFVRFQENNTIPIALHMTNTVFIDRAIIVQPFMNGDIPDELSGLQYANSSGGVCGETRLPPHVSNEKNDGGEIITVDLNMSQTGLPPFPPLSATLDDKVVEEIRRTVIIMGVGATSTNQDVIDFFTNGSGEVKYFRWCSNKSESDGSDTKTALVEFSDYGAVIPAMRLNNTMLGDNIVKVYFSSQSITKPQTKSNEAAQKEIAEAMKKVKEAQNLVTAAVDPLMGMLGVKQIRSRSRTPSRSRDYDRHSGRRSRSRSRDRYRRRSRERRRSRSRRSRSRRRSRDRKKRSRSRRRSRTRSKDRKKEEKKKEIKEEKPANEDGTNGDAPADVTNGKTTEEVVKPKSRSKSKERKRSRSRSRSRKHKKRSRSRDRRRRSRSRDRRDRRRSRSRDHKSSKSKKERRRSRDRDERKDKDPITRDYDQEEAGYENFPSKTSKEANSDMEISNSP